MILLLVLLSCKLKVTAWRLQPGPSKVFQPIRNRSFNKEVGVQTPSATMLFFDWLVSILNSSPFRMVRRNTYPPFLCGSFFENFKGGHDIDGKGWLY